MSLIPSHLQYTKEHEWIEKRDSFLQIGITDYAQSSLGDVVFIEFTTDDQSTVKKGDVVANIESVKAVSEIYAPVSGRLLEKNVGINDSPEALNKEPYSGGWLFKMEPDSSEELESLINAEQYKEYISGL